MIKQHLFVYPIDAWRVLLQMQHGITPSRAIKLTCHACTGTMTNRCVLGWRICKHCADDASDLPAIVYMDKYFEDYPAIVQQLTANITTPTVTLVTPLVSMCARCLTHGEHEYVSVDDTVTKSVAALLLPPLSLCHDVRGAIREYSWLLILNDIVKITPY